MARWLMADAHGGDEGGSRLDMTSTYFKDKRHQEEVLYSLYVWVAECTSDHDTGEY